MRTRLWCLFFFISAASTFGIDVEVSSRFDNLYWNSTRRDDASGRTFSASDLFWTLQGSVTQELADGLLFKGGVENDPILRWRAYSQLGFSLEGFSLKFAPFLGVFNSTQKWFSPGMDASVQYTWPGFVFVRGGFLTTFAPISKTGDYYLSALNAAVGVQVPNGIITFNVEDKSATFRVMDGLTTIDESTKYWLDTEMFIKNFPLRWAILSGYQITNRSYVTNSEDTTPVYSILVGARFSWDFSADTTAFVQMESSFFNTGLGSTNMNLASTALIYDAVAGVRYHL